LIGANLIEVHDDFLLSEDFEALATFLDAPIWRFGWGSKKADVFRFWHAALTTGPAAGSRGIVFDLESLHASVSKLIGKVEELAGPDVRLEKIYANGHTYGCEGYLHTDFFEEGDRINSYVTAVLFAHKNWDPDWAGELSFFDTQSRNIGKAILPTPNRLVIFPAHVNHVARSPSRACPLLRVSIVLKFCPTPLAGN
jgi:SM-20-related protein